MDQILPTNVKDEDVPQMLFLSVNPTTVEEDNLQVVADDGAVGIGGFATPSRDIGSCVGLNSTDRLLSKLRTALNEQSIKSLRQELQLRLLKLTTLTPHEENNLNTLENNFSDEADNLTNNEEEVLEFTEILERLKYPVPEKIKEIFYSIVRSKKIPLTKSEGSKKKTFFVYAEYKTLMKVCNSLSAEEVHEIYRLMKMMKDVGEDNDMKDFLEQPCPPSEALEKVPGLKDVAFYHLVLNLMRKKMMNRLYTHKLNFLFTQLKQSLTEEKKSCVHIDRAINILSRYPIASQPPGLCIIFTMVKDREGAQKDLTRVKDLFGKAFMYDVLVKIDPTAENIKFIISKLKAARNKFYDSLVVWFMGHGSKTYLTVSGGEIHRRNDLIQPFTEIEWFNKKPKLFFIQACAVKNTNKRISGYGGTDHKALSTQTDSQGWKAPASRGWQEKYAEYTDVCNINCFADTLISYATMWYQEASRGEEGSLYVDTLVDQLEEYGSKESIENVLRRVHYNVNTVSLLQDGVQWKQAPYFESSLQKEFIFQKTTM